MAQYSSSSRGCNSCGGGSYRPPLPPAVPDPCAGGLGALAPLKEKTCGCGCGPGQACTCQTRAPTPQKNYNSDDCPTFAISCETKQALRDCVKVALCDFLRCVTDAVCPDGQFNLAQLQARKDLQNDLINCVGQLACSFMHCVPEVLCPEPCVPTVPADCLPCEYAVEAPKSVAQYTVEVRR